MFGKSIRLFTLFGFEVKIDASWLIIAAVITWSLAMELFPFYVKDLSAGVYWLMGALGAIGLFFSIIFHEMSHSLVARRFGLPIKGITLFIFGGVAQMEDEPSSPKAEFLMAIAGPISSVILSAIFYGILASGNYFYWPKTVTVIIGYLAFINLALAAFNLIPAFPLDGGRVLRSGLWRWKNNIKWATMIASRIGSAFGIILILLGIFQIFISRFINGLWWVMIGMFMQNAAQMSYRQLLARETLEGEKVERFMKKNPITVSPTLTLENLVEDYIYKYHYKMFPVIDENNILGMITTKRLKEVSREDWKRKTVNNVMIKCSAENTITPDTDAVKAMALMNRTGNSRILVADENKLSGILTLKDIMKFISIKLELGI